MKTLPRLNGTTVTGDAVNCSAATASEIHALGGDYVLHVKGNQPTVQTLCEAAFRDMPGPAASHIRLCSGF